MHHIERLEDGDLHSVCGAERDRRQTELLRLAVRFAERDEDVVDVGVADHRRRDAGEGALASVLETAGAVAAIVVSLPLFRAVWDLLESLL